MLVLIYFSLKNELCVARATSYVIPYTPIAASYIFLEQPFI
jgi:hypothetical protein